MTFTETGLQGAYAIHPTRIADHRGYFARAFCQSEFGALGLRSDVAQMNVAFNPKTGTLRGMHFQEAPHAEAKLVRCTRGALFDVIVDLRPGSPTLGRWFGAELSAENGVQLYAPEGFAHGYQTLMPDSEICYLTSASYAPAAARGVRFDDPVFGIAWPLPVSAISDADRQWPDFRP